MKRWALAALLVCGLILFFLFDLDRFVSFQALSENRDELKAFVARHPILAPALFMLIYAGVVAFSLPGGAVMTIAGGFLFGAVMASVLVVLSATVGATIVFLAAKSSLGEMLKRRAGPWLGRMERGFQENALSYLLVLRLIPLFPFFVVNLVPAFLGVSLGTYFFGTLIGIIPGSVVYATVGAGLDSVFQSDGVFQISDVMTPEVLAGLVGLAVLSLLPVAYKRWRKTAPVDDGFGTG